MGGFERPRAAALDRPLVPAPAPAHPDAVSASAPPASRSQNGGGSPDAMTALYGGLYDPAHGVSSTLGAVVDGDSALGAVVDGDRAAQIGRRASRAVTPADAPPTTHPGDPRRGSTAGARPHPGPSRARANAEPAGQPEPSYSGEPGAMTQGDREALASPDTPSTADHPGVLSRVGAALAGGVRAAGSAVVDQIHRVPDRVRNLAAEAQHPRVPEPAQHPRGPEPVGPPPTQQPPPIADPGLPDARTLAPIRGSF